jgi:hypothetical protein
MPVARPVPEALDAAALRRPLAASSQPSGDAGRPAVARLADDLAVPTPSPVHRLQAGLAQLTTAEAVSQDRLYAGWFRVTFPLVASAALWAAILWGFAQLA